MNELQTDAAREDRKTWRGGRCGDFLIQHLGMKA
jgi:hypothetical protein